MFPVNTRPVIRSRSPPPRRHQHQPEAQVHDQDGTSTSDESRDETPRGSARESGNRLTSTDTAHESTSPVDPTSVSIRAAIREYELIHDELRTVNARARALRTREQGLREDVQRFMQLRNLERLGTRDGRIAVRVMTKSTTRTPGKKETLKCVDETIGQEHPELAQLLVRKLYEDNYRVRTFARFDKRAQDETPNR